jgi:hypothetical protein
LHSHFPPVAIFSSFLPLLHPTPLDFSPAKEAARFVPKQSVLPHNW